MKVESASIEMEASLKLTEQEVAVLQHITSYDLAASIFKNVTQKYSLAELRAVLNPLFQTTSGMDQRFKNTRREFKTPVGAILSTETLVKP